MQYRFTEGVGSVDPAEEARRIDAAALQAFTARVFEGLGMPAGDAATEAEVLVWANLRGIDSHGVQRVAAYSRAVDNGSMNPRPRIRVERETAATVLIEADHAFGPVVTVQAMERVIAKARTAGIGWGLIRNTSHQGAMAYYTQMAAAADLVGVAVVCSPPNMAPPGAKQAGTHNSPIAVAVPGARRPSISLDMATSVAAGGKLDVALDKGTAIPEEWALDADGRPTTDPAQSAFLRPAAGYKGYGLALIFECLSSLMVGNPLLATTIGPECPARRHPEQRRGRHRHRRLHRRGGVQARRRPAGRHHERPGHRGRRAAGVGTGPAGGTSAGRAHCRRHPAARRHGRQAARRRRPLRPRTAPRARVTLRPNSIRMPVPAVCMHAHGSYAAFEG